MVSSRKFVPETIESFRFIDYDFRAADVTARLRYALDDIDFTEIFTFPGANLPLDDRREQALDRCLKYLHLAAGVSYYKAAAPAKIIVETGGLGESAANFYENLYLQGLGEFAWQNGLDLGERIRFPRAGNTAKAISLELPRLTAVPVGGGKDSVVSIEALKQAHEPLVLFSLGDHPVLRKTADCAGLPKITVKRDLCPNLLDINTRGALNGHVPISAIIAFTTAVAAVLYGFDSAALSNERSASSPNFIHDGRAVNHQYSKSLDFERQVADFMENHVVSGFRYFSFLRPLSELSITRLFSKSEDYHRIFTSCNKGFAIYRRDEKRWCRACPKCRFVFVALAPFLPKQKLVAIFGGNLLDDAAQAGGYDELAGIAGHKPFECVGEIEEVRAAFALLMEKPQWAGDTVVKRMKNMQSHPGEWKSLVESTFAFADEHMLPSRYEEILRAYLGA